MEVEVVEGLVLMVMMEVMMGEMMEEMMKEMKVLTWMLSRGAQVSLVLLPAAGLLSSQARSVLPSTLSTQMWPPHLSPDNKCKYLNKSNSSPSPVDQYQDGNRQIFISYLASNLWQSVPVLYNVLVHLGTSIKNLFLN